MTTSTVSANPKSSVFLTPETAKKCIDAVGSPAYAYSLAKLNESSGACLAFPNAYGLTVRYAMKACPNAAILKYFNSKGIHIDASSGYEVSDRTLETERLVESANVYKLAPLTHKLVLFQFIYM
jgi:diaminopimelate decarboxylase